MERIFDMFSQVDRPIERSTGGLGIGLALVKGLVEAHGGTIKGESEGIGKGSTFTITLPMLSDPQAADCAGPHDERTPSPSRRILVVDDNRDGAASLTLMLTLLNNEVRMAHDGAEAIEVADQFHPEIILMDVGMPRMNGYDAARRIREFPWGQDVQIIALTGWGQDHDRERSRQAGCNAHLVKPVELRHLGALLRGHNGDVSM